MTTLAEIVIERDSANDSEAVVVEIRCASGAAVTKGQRLLDIETSKAVQEVAAPADGIFVHALKVGDAVAWGVAIASIHDTAPEPATATTAAVNGASGVHAGVVGRFSREAAALAAQHNLAATSFGTDFITTADVRRKLGLSQPPQAVMAPVSAGPATALEPSAPPRADLSRIPAHKREEARVLGGGAGASMLSVIGIELGLAGLRRQGAGVLFASKIIDLVAFEAARLLCDFKKLNAAWYPEGIEYHAEINAGIAYDEAGRLLVYGIRGADALSLEEIQDQIFDGLKKYRRNRLDAAALTSATFTVTDLSPLGGNFMLPLLPQGQSCIIGIAGGGERPFNLFLGFDHRITEGLDASRFLAELRQRVLGHIFDKDLPPRKCHFCDSEFTATSPGKGLLRLIDATGAEILSCRECWAAG